MSNQENEFDNLGRELVEYCKKFFIPSEHLFDILYDQKVIPMIRGKGMEYNADAVLRRTLSSRNWVVTKLNLPAQPGNPDQDITIQHRRSGVVITVESKSAARGTFTKGTNRTQIKNEPHFKVKCHRSRSNMEIAATSNDRYHYSSFDIVITNVLNSIYEGNTIGEDFELIDSTKLEPLYRFYSVNSREELEEAAYNDWRFALSRDIAVNEFIPRTPSVRLENDPNWKSLDKLEDTLLVLVGERR